MRSGGHRIAGSDPALRQAVHGWLLYKRTPADDYGPRWEAHLLDRPNGKALTLPLFRARFARVDGVLHIVGTEEGGRTNTKARPSLWKQSWLAAQDPADALPFLDKVSLSSATGFSPEADHLDDDPYAPLYL